ncbi:calnexin independence factor cif1 [Gigaspora margarita]|uniref:Calnexin independence factor cif1 n=1 Tax=Gigaspora margarita TaxID=4874 RepID=A0A8H3X7T7_GIGMA|nr:calnexin independence factor cif1 [Gigaspora margarita]
MLSCICRWRYKSNTKLFYVINRIALAFPQKACLEIIWSFSYVVNIKQAVAFRSNQTKTEIGSLFADYDLGWSGRSNEDDPSPKYLPPTLGSGDNEAKLKNHRRMNIDLEPARRGLPAQHRK